MVSRYVTLGNGRKVSLAGYVRAWRICLAAAPSTPVRECPDGSYGNAAEALQQFRAGLHDRINRHDLAYGRGRKWSSDWQRHTLQAAGFLNIPRLTIDWLPADLKARFAHRLRSIDA